VVIPGAAQSGVSTTDFRVRIDGNPAPVVDLQPVDFWRLTLGFKVNL
jgi:hypothetical protein